MAFADYGFFNSPRTNTLDIPRAGLNKPPGVKMRNCIFAPDALS